MASTEARMTAINMPGQFGRQRRSAKMIAAEPRPIHAAIGLIVGNADAMAASLGIMDPVQRR